MFVTRKKKLLTVTIILAIICILCGLIIMMNGNFLSIFFILGGFGMLTIYEGVVIDNKLKRIKEFNSYFGIKNGKWQKLPEINYILIKQLTETITDVKGRKSSSKVFKVFLKSIDRRENILVYEALSKSEAINVGNLISGYLRVRIKVIL